MAINIQLTSAMRSNLLSLQQTARSIGITQERLSTGRRVNSASDDATAYFSAQQGFQKATDLSSLKADMGEGLQKIKTATTTLDSVNAVMSQMKGLINQAKATADTTTRTQLAAQYDSLRDQLNQLTANDANYKGTNLLAANNDLVVNFNETASSKITIASTDVTAGAYSVDVSANNWAAAGDINAAETNLTSATTAFQNLSKTLASQSTYIQTRIDFTAQLANNFKSGAENLVAADMNEEGANLLSLNVQQQLGTTALSLSSQAAQAILRLF
jgi:flagellin-like hook-associated protein FlgL